MLEDKVSIAELEQVLVRVEEKFRSKVEAEDFQEALEELKESGLGRVNSQYNENLLHLAQEVKTMKELTEQKASWRDLKVAVGQFKVSRVSFQDNRPGLPAI